MPTTEQTETAAQAVTRRVAAFANSAICEAIATGGVLGNRMESRVENVGGLSCVVLHEYTEDLALVGTATFSVEFREETGFSLALVTVSDGETYRTESAAATLPEAVRVLRGMVEVLVGGSLPEFPDA